MVGMGTSCGACKFLRRKCEELCIFAPYFSYEQAEVHFAAVHKVFGASNVSKLLAHLPIHNRNAAAATISFEAQARIDDPVRGCVSHILALQQQIAILQEEIELLTAQIMQPKNYYKEAMERLEECLFNDEASVLEELISVYMTELEEDLLL